MTTAVQAPTKSKRRSRSYSQLSDFLHCGWAYRLKRVVGVPEHPSVWLAGGKAFHTATEHFDLATWNLDVIPADVSDKFQWITDFDDCFNAELDGIREERPDVPESQWRTAGRKTQAKPNGEDVDWWRENGALMVSAYVDWRVANNHRLRIAVFDGIPAIELEVDMPLGGVPMRGYVDRVLLDVENGSLLLTDIKSGSRMPLSPLQLATYAAQLERRAGRKIEWGAFYDARKGLLTDPINLERFDPNILGDLYRRFDRAANQGLFLPKIDNHCSACGVRAACIYRGGVEPS